MDKLFNSNASGIFTQIFSLFNPNMRPIVNISYQQQSRGLILS